MDLAVESISYDIDSDGDIELILKHPNTQNIVPQLHQDPSTSCFDNPPCSGKYLIFNVLDMPPIDGENPNEVKVHIRVSSRHLILASRTFRVMLQGPWSEGSSSSSQHPTRRISASDWDATAFAIVLDIIHGKHQDVPRSVNLGLLTRIATIVDYYECREAVQIFVDTWLSNMPTRRPTSYCQSALMWLYILWVFSVDDKLSAISKIVLKRSEDPSEIEANDLPVLGILETLDKKRQELINSVLVGLDDLYKSLYGEERHPQHRRSPYTTAILNKLRHELQIISHLDPPLVSPFQGYSIASVIKLVNKMPAIIRVRMKPVLYAIGDEINTFEMVKSDQ